MIYRAMAASAHIPLVAFIDRIKKEQLPQSDLAIDCLQTTVRDHQIHKRGNALTGVHIDIDLGTVEQSRTERHCHRYRVGSAKR